MSLINYLTAMNNRLTIDFNSNLAEYFARDFSAVLLIHVV